MTGREDDVFPAEVMQLLGALSHASAAERLAMPDCLGRQAADQHNGEDVTIVLNSLN